MKKIVLDTILLSCILMVVLVIIFTIPIFLDYIFSLEAEKFISTKSANFEWIHENEFFGEQEAIIVTVRKEPFPRALISMYVKANYENRSSFHSHGRTVILSSTQAQTLRPGDKVKVSFLQSNEMMDSFSTMIIKE